MIGSAKSHSTEQHIIRCVKCGYREKLKNRKQALKAKKHHLKFNDCIETVIDFGPISMVKQK